MRRMVERQLRDKNGGLRHPGGQRRGWLRRLLPFAVIVAVWWLATSVLGLAPSFMLPGPDRIVRRGIVLYQSGVLVDAVGSSILRMVPGFVLGTIVGSSLGLLVGINRYVSGFVTPLATFFQAVAGPTWIPLAVLWFGLGWRSIAFIVFNTVFFLVFYNTLVGITTINRNMLDSVKTLGGQRLDLLWNVYMPGALPHTINGLRVGIAYGWRALIAGEILATDTGLGKFVWDGLRYFRTSDIFLGLFLIGLVSLLMEALVIRPLELRTVRRWGMVRAEIG